MLLSKNLPVCLSKKFWVCRGKKWRELWVQTRLVFICGSSEWLCEGVWGLTVSFSLAREMLPASVLRTFIWLAARGAWASCWEASHCRQFDTDKWHFSAADWLSIMALYFLPFLSLSSRSLLSLAASPLSQLTVCWFLVVVWDLMDTAQELAPPLINLSTPAHFTIVSRAWHHSGTSIGRILSIYLCC